MPKTIRMLRIDTIMRKIRNLTGGTYPALYSALYRSEDNVMQEVHDIINNLSDQITVLNRKLKAEQEKNKS